MSAKSKECVKLLNQTGGFVENYELPLENEAIHHNPEYGRKSPLDATTLRISWFHKAKIPYVQQQRICAASSRSS